MITIYQFAKCAAGMFPTRRTSNYKDPFVTWLSRASKPHSCVVSTIKNLSIRTMGTERFTSNLNQWLAAGPAAIYRGYMELVHNGGPKTLNFTPVIHIERNWKRPRCCSSARLCRFAAKAITGSIPNTLIPLP